MKRWSNWAASIFLAAAMLFAANGGAIAKAGLASAVDGGPFAAGNAAMASPSDVWWNPSWGYRAPVTVTNPNPGPLTNFQVKVALPYRAAMKADFGDVRFITTDNVVLQFWTDPQKLAPSTSAECWVKVPSLPAATQSDIYVYYGNPAAASASDIHTTFIFGDDFESASWTNAHLYANTVGGSTTETFMVDSANAANHILDQFGNNTNTSVNNKAETIMEVGQAGSLTPFPLNYVAELSTRSVVPLPTVGAVGAYICARYLRVEDKYEQVLDFTNSIADLNKVVLDTWSNLASVPLGYNTTAGTWYTLGAGIHRQTGPSTDNLTVSVNGVQYFSVLDNSLMSDTGLAFLTYNHTGPFHLQYDDFRVREWAAQQPTTTIGAGAPFGPSVLVSPVSGLTTTEALGTATFSMVLSLGPVADVVIGLSSSDTTEGTVSPASVTFTPGNWATPRTVTVTGVDDPYDDGNIAYAVLTSNAVSTDSGYTNLAVSDVAITNTDNDTAAVTVTPTSGLVTTEAGGTATFTVALAVATTANVTIGLSSSDTTEGTVLPASLTFTAAGWNTPQTVTVTGVDDALADGPIAYSIITAAAASLDPGYSGLVVADVGVTNSDNDTAGFTVAPTAGLITTEAGGTATFTVRLNMAPTTDVGIGLSSSDTSEGTVSPASLTFTTANWNTPQTVTVTGVNDFVADGNVAYSVVTAPATAGGAYSGLDAADVSVTNTDNDVAGITVNPVSGLVTTEAAGTAAFTVVLTSAPTGNVTVGLSSSDATEGTVSPLSLVFSPTNWNTPQTVTVTGVNDDIFDGSIAYTIVTAPAVSADPGYSGRNAADVSVTNTDNDAPLPPVSSGGSTGGSGPPPTGQGVTGLSPYTSDEGLFNLSATIRSEDGKAVLAIARGVTARTVEGGVLRSIKIVPLGTQPVSADDNRFLGLAYEITPEGAAFAPAITLTIYYDPAKLPLNVNPDSIALVVFNPTTGRWETVPGVLNKTEGTVTATIGHFSSYALSGRLAAPPTTAVPAPVPTSKPPVLPTQPVPTTTPNPAPTTAAPTIPAPTPTPAAPAAAGTPWGAIIGIIAGLVVVTGIIVIVVRRRKTSK